MAPSAAQAGLGAAAAVQFFPEIVKVGDSGTAFITLVNNNVGGETGATNTVCNLNDPCPYGGLGVDNFGISAVPACQTLSAGIACAAGAADPDVFSLSATGTGAAASTCAGTIFDIVRVTGDVPDVGRFRFTPRAPGSPVTLPGNGATCQINFTYTVLKTPKDAVPSTPTAFETNQFTFHRQISSALPFNSSAEGRGSASDQAILKANPTIETVASGDIALGGQLTDQATVRGLGSPVAGSDITFRLYPPSAGAACLGTPVFTSTKPT